MTQTVEQKLIAFAQAVGLDYKNLQQQLANKISSQDLQNALNNFKTQLFGGDVDAALDTFLELGNKLKELSNDDSISSAILQKFTEIREEITNIQTALNTDLVLVYNQAKAG